MTTSKNWDLFRRRTRASQHGAAPLDDLSPVHHYNTKKSIKKSGRQTIARRKKKQSAASSISIERLYNRIQAILNTLVGARLLHDTAGKGSITSVDYRKPGSIGVYFTIAFVEISGIIHSETWRAAEVIHYATDKNISAAIFDILLIIDDCTKLRPTSSTLQSDYKAILDRISNVKLNLKRLRNSGRLPQKCGHRIVK